MPLAVPEAIASTTTSHPAGAFSRDEPAVPLPVPVLPPPMLTQPARPVVAVRSSLQIKDLATAGVE